MPEGKTKSLAQRADELEEAAIAALDAAPCKSVIYTSGEQDPTAPILHTFFRPDGRKLLMGHDKRLQKMPAKPGLLDFFRHRFSPANHVLQSATLAKKAGHPEKVILACLLHDISIMGFIRGDHGFWAAQMVEPYVAPEVAWAIRAHQVLRFFPDPAAGYEYPEAYVKMFGEGYRPEPYMQVQYEKMRRHEWYMTGRLITVNDIYAFDPDAKVSLDDFVDVIGRNFCQPAEGLGFDDSPSAHMWRTINWPTRAL
jgi:HD domain